MTNLDRRTFLGAAGLSAVAAVLGDGAIHLARADKPVNFSGWVFKPDTVKDYVDFFNKKHGGQEKYAAIPWATYHPTMETRAMAGEVVDVMYCNAANRERWFDNGLVRALDDLPGMDELKRKIAPANLDSLRSKDGSKIIALPYFTSLFILIYNEPMLQQAGIKAPAKSWDELVEHSAKLKRERSATHRTCRTGTTAAPVPCPSSSATASPRAPASSTRRTGSSRIRNRARLAPWSAGRRCTATAW